MSGCLLLLFVALGWLLSRTSYRRGFKDGYSAYQGEVDCATCESLDSCKNPDAEYCKWEP